MLKFKKQNPTIPRCFPSGGCMGTLLFQNNNKNITKQRQKLYFVFALNVSKIHIEIIFFISFRNIIVCKQTIIEIFRLRYTTLKMTCWGLFFAKYYDVKYFLYNIFIITILLNCFYFFTDIYTFKYFLKFVYY